MPVNVRVHRKGGLLESNSHDYTGSFVPHASKLLKLFKGVWDFPLMFFYQGLQSRESFKEKMLPGPLIMTKFRYGILYLNFLMPANAMKYWSLGTMKYSFDQHLLNNFT